MQRDEGGGMDLNEFAEAAGMDLNEVLERFSGNRALLVRMIKKFPGDTAFTELSSAMGTRNYKAASEAAHSLKGLAGNLGFNSLFALAGRMNRQGKAGDYSDFESLFSELKPDYERIVEAIRELE